MATGVAVAVEEYLSTVYETDCEYADGELIERSLCDIPHSDLQGSLYSFFRKRRTELDIYPFFEQRVRIRERRYMVPDVCVVKGPKPNGKIISEPPLD